MTPTTYNASIAVGLGSVTGGVALAYGPALALIVAGSLVIALTLFAAIRG